MDAGLKKMASRVKSLPMIDRGNFARIWQYIIHLPKTMPILSILLLALVIGTLASILSATLVPYHDNLKSSDTVMRDFFYKPVVKNTVVKNPVVRPELFNLSSAKFAPSSIDYLSPAIKVSPAVYRVIVQYSETEPKPNAPINLSLTSASGNQEKTTILGTSILPSLKPIILEFQSQSPEIQLGLVRAPAAKDANWPEITIMIKQAPDE